MDQSIAAWALWRVEVAEDVEFIHAGQRGVEDIDDEQQTPVLLGQAPPVDVGGDEEESHRGHQHKTRVDQA